KRVENRLTKMTKASQLKSIALLLMVVTIYIIQNYTPILIRDRMWFPYLSKPIAWIILIIVVLRLPRVRPNSKARLMMLMKWVIGFCGILYVIIMVFGGIIGGFAKSPFNHSLYGIISNIMFIFIPLVGREIVRSYLVNGIKYKNYFLFLGLISILFTLTELPVSSINNLKTKLELVTYLGEIFIPRLCNNILASYLVYRGGASFSIIYIIIYQSFNWFFPVLPNPPWSIKILIDILYPIFTLTFLEYFYSSKINKPGRGHLKRENPLGWAAITSISILIIWFTAGVFPVQPFVIVTGSMEPIIYPGDVVLVNKAEVEKLKVGDVIQFQHENIFIFHRIIEVVSEKEEVKYRTKGDNNSAVDYELVKISDIRGRVVYTIPKIGWPTLLLKSQKDVDKREVEF
ncbi:MAG: peptidase signal peptidase, partial [Clostridiales bacterium]|nr:peptidase signal peptidase [Clostridiales bacterium]